MNETEEMYLENLLGKNWRAAVESLSTTELMRHPDRNYRRAGIVLHQWKEDPHASQKLIDIFDSDLDECVRADAIISLGRAFHGSGNRIIGAFLLSVLLHNKLTLVCRQAAYVGIIDVFLPSTIDSSILTAVESMPANIDYQSIISYIDRQDGTP